MTIRTNWKGWLLGLLGPSEGNRVPQGRNKAPFKPWLDVLEARNLPSVFTVTSAEDGCDPLIPNTLRWAIGNAGNGHLINFAAKLSGQTIQLSTF